MRTCLDRVVLKENLLSGVIFESQVVSRFLDDSRSKECVCTIEASATILESVAPGNNYSYFDYALTSLL